MPLSDSEERILRAAGSDPSPVARQQAVGITLAKHGEDASDSRELLTQSYLTHTSPSFHLVPKGDSMFAEDAFTEAYVALSASTDDFTRDEAARIQTLVTAANERGLRACALVDGKGWAERPNALCDVILATQGRTYTLSTVEQILELPEIQALIAD